MLPAFSVMADLVRKFVLGFLFRRKMFGQLITRLGNRMDEGDGILTGFEMGNDLVTEGIPELRTAFLVDGNVAEDGECLRLGRDEDQNGVKAGHLGIHEFLISTVHVGDAECAEDACGLCHL
jgi:hypothetical protein